jgi:hypothetical protein
MEESTWRLSLLTCVAIITVACGSGASATSSAGVSRQAGQQRVGPVAPAKPLPSPIASKPLAGDPQSCVFDGGGFASITISVRPGLGDVSVAAWTNGTMPVSGVAVSGIGDRSVWQDTLRELIATRHNVLCDIGSSGAKGSAGDVEKKFAALCGKIWAAS